MAFLAQSSKALSQSSIKLHGQVCHDNTPLLVVIFISVWVSIAVVNHHDQNQLGEETVYFISCFVVHHQEKQRLQLKDSNCHRGSEEPVINGWLFMACSTYFLRAFRTYFSGVAPPTIGRTILEQSRTKKMPYRFVYRWIVWAHFLNYESLSPNDSNLCQVNKKLATTLDYFAQ